MPTKQIKMMEKSTVLNLIKTLGNQRRLRWYCPGSYAYWLLADAIGDGCAIKTLREKSVSRLLQRQDIKAVLAQCGDGVLRPSQLPNSWNHDAFPLVLSLGIWGGYDAPYWYQTSRPGYNLVLRFDFAGDHMAELHKRFGRYGWLFNSANHPVASHNNRKRETLAWARLDIDLETNEVLIEELQSDWVRDAQFAAKHGWRSDNRWITATEAAAYYKQVLKPIQASWQEAVLSGTLGFIRDELQVQNVFYHDTRTGPALKRMGYSKPPRSLYQDLPKRFCMSTTDIAPTLLLRHSRCRRVLKKIRPHRFFRYQLNVGAGETYA